LALEAFERVFRDAHDAAHYTTDYSTKWSDSVGVVLPHLCHGFDNLQPLSAIGVAKEQSLASGERAEVDSYAQKKGERRGAAGVVDRAALVERGRLAIVRRETSANRTVLKKLPEMMFHLLWPRMLQVASCVDHIHGVPNSLSEASARSGAAPGAWRSSSGLCIGWCLRAIVRSCSLHA